MEDDEVARIVRRLRDGDVGLSVALFGVVMNKHLPVEWRADALECLCIARSTHGDCKIAASIGWIEACKSESAALRYQAAACTSDLPSHMRAILWPAYGEPLLRDTDDDVRAAAKGYVDLIAALEADKGEANAS